MKSAIAESPATIAPAVFAETRPVRSPNAPTVEGSATFVGVACLLTLVTYFLKVAV